MHAIPVACRQGCIRTDCVVPAAAALHGHVRFFQTHNASPAVEREVYRYYYYVYTRFKQVEAPGRSSLLDSAVVPVAAQGAQ
jgi:hypothetical protein